nr:hypothetical protein JKL49_26180 [Phenylobacterium glaciei]
MAGVAWTIMQAMIFRKQGEHSVLRQALGRDLKAKASPVIYLAGVGLSFVWTPGAALAYLAVALMWLVPDRRVEKHVVAHNAQS